MSFFNNSIYNNVNNKIIDLYEKENFILDIGCGTGALARELKNINSKCIVHGIDIRIQDDNLLKNVDNFLCLDLDYSDLPNLDKKFDLIILGDVLEHLKNPDIILSELKNLLKDDGRIIISIPNIAYFRIRLRLLFGNFNYGDTGIMDKTHLRFFTQKSIKNLINSSGYLIEKEKFIFSKKLFFIKDDLKNKIAHIFYRLFSIQFVFKIKKYE